MDGLVCLNSKPNPTHLANMSWSEQKRVSKTRSNDLTCEGELRRECNFIGKKK